MDPRYKFAVGIQKGRPLDSAGMPYRIIKWKNEHVALFRNGTMARFYIDDTIAANTPPIPSEPDMPELPGPSQPAVVVDPESFFKPLKETVYPVSRKSIGVFKNAAGVKSSNPCDPVYCVLENGRAQSNADRNTVGTGLREYLWLYDKLRELGHGRVAALLEAYEIYFL